MTVWGVIYIVVVASVASFALGAHFTIWVLSNNGFHFEFDKHKQIWKLKEPSINSK